MMIHKHSANHFLPQQVPMGCTMVQDLSRLLSRSYPKLLREVGLSPRQGPAVPFGLNL